MAGTPTTREAFYTRKPTGRRFELTDRDHTVLMQLALRRFLRKSQLLSYVGGSEQMLAWRLKKMFDYKLISRPRRQIAVLADEPSPDGVYALTMTGARIVASRHGWDLERFAHLGKNERVGAEFILHAVGMADVTLSFALGAPSAGLTGLREQRDLIPDFPLETQKRRNPFLWQTRRVPYDDRYHDINLVPDWVLSLITPKDERYNLLLEFDRTLTIRPHVSHFRRNTNAWKLAAYTHGFRTDVHSRDFGFQRMRVAFITTTPLRVAKLADLARDITHDSLPGLFLFTDIQKVRTQGVYAPIWTTSRGDTVALL